MMILIVIVIGQVYEDPSDKIVEFTPLQLWNIGEENTIEYVLPSGFEEASSDWIGIYKVRACVLQFPIVIIPFSFILTSSHVCCCVGKFLELR